MAGVSTFFKAGGGRVACALLLLAAIALMGFAGSAANAQSNDESFLAAKPKGTVGDGLQSVSKGYIPISDDEREDELNAYDDDDKQAGADGDFGDDEDFEDDGQESLLENEGVAREDPTASYQQTPYGTDYDNDAEDYDVEDGDEDYDDGPEPQAASSFAQTEASDNDVAEDDDDDALDENQDELEAKVGEKNDEKNGEEEGPAFLEDEEMDDEDDLDEMDDRYNDMDDARDRGIGDEDVDDEKTEVPSMVDLEDDDDVPMVEDQTGVERKMLSQVSNERPIHPHSMLDVPSPSTSDKMIPNQETISIGVKEALHMPPIISSDKLETKSNRQL